MTDVEICIESISVENVINNVKRAHRGGAARIELCSAMHLDGLTPVGEHIKAARKAFYDRAGLMVMIRPRGGDFVYTGQEVATMLEQIRVSAECGADGVVFGALRAHDKRIDAKIVKKLCRAASDHNLAVTFHRAFDAVSDPLETLAELADLGVDHVLTSGVPWGEPGGAMQGLQKLKHYVAQAENIKVIIGGGVRPENALSILDSVALPGRRLSLHAYSGVLEKGVVSVQAVRRLVELPQPYSS